MKIALVNMPWSSIDNPSLALGILQRAVARQVPGAEVTVVHANLNYVDWITARREFGLSDYRHYSAEAYFSGSGDWVFSSALYADPGWRVDEFEQYWRGQEDDGRIALSVALHRLAPGFIAQLARQIAGLGPDVVGFTTTFQQNTAALAAARELKRIDPSVVTVFGGANCDGSQGEALHRNFSFIDYVVRGEGEAALPELLRQLREGGQAAPYPGCAGGGRTAARPPTR